MGKVVKKAKPTIPKVAVFLLDGVRYDSLMHQVNDGQADILKKIIEEGSFSKGHVGKESDQSYSGFGWRTITGFTTDHGVIDNSFSDNRMDRPDFISLAISQNKSLKALAYVTWNKAKVHIFDRFNHSENVKLKSFGDQNPVEGESHLCDRRLTENVIGQLDESQMAPDILFVGFDSPDDAGHAAGYSNKSPLYLKTIRDVSGHIENIVKKIESLPSFKQEDWIFILTTDHGGRSDRTHFKPSTEFTRRTWVAVAGHTRKIGLPKVVDSKDISAIAYRHMNLDPPAYYEGDMGKFRLQRRENTIPSFAQA